MQEYDQIADWYAATRREDVGREDVQTLARSLPPDARVLDLGCGTGRPLSEVLAKTGVALVGLDSSADMIERFEANLPGIPILHERIQDARFPEASFDAVVAWGVLFHLSDADQADVVFRISTWLKPGGRFLFTSGEDAGTRAGEMNGVAFTYRSLGAPAYRQLVEAAGMHLVDVHQDAWDNSVYLAQRCDVLQAAA